MVYAQNINFGSMAVNQEFVRICSEHPGCKDCPMKEKDINIQGMLVRCETGRNNQT